MGSLRWISQQTDYATKYLQSERHFVSHCTIGRLVLWQADTQRRVSKLQKGVTNARFREDVFITSRT
jgi:hypothetical protein